ncbi:MAG: hypothetical protein ACYTBJ_21700 [Planctomycetota bacterium]|jgi:hypothetical protein
MAVVFLCPTIVAQELQWLQYWSAREASMGRRTVDLSNDKPEGVELPDFESKSPVFGRWRSPMVTSGYLWVVLDRTHKYGPYDQLFIDSDGDGQLNDETVVAAYRVEQDRSTFGPVKVIFQGEDGPITYHLKFQFRSRNDDKQLKASSAGWYEGTITLGEKRYTCVLIDQNVNGAFDDKSLHPPNGDRIRIAQQGNADTRFVGNFIQVNEVLYRLEIARDGAFVKLAKAEGVTFGKIRLPESITQFAAGGENGLFTIKPLKGSAQLPVGSYRIDSWLIEHLDEKGHRWQLEGERFDEKGNFEVNEVGETSLTLGEPVISSLIVRKVDSEYSFRQHLRGQLGDFVTLTLNDTEPPQAPKLNIKSADGKYERTFSFEYG